MVKFDSAVRTAPTSTARALLVIGAAIGFVATPAQAQIQIGVDSGLVPNDICLSGENVIVSGAQDDCTLAGSVSPGFLQIGPDSSYALFDATNGQSTFTATATFNNHVQMNGTQTFAGNSTFTGLVSFQGSSVTFATPTFFTFPSTFQAATTFNGGITSNNITNSGTINSTNVNVTGSLTAAPGTNINFGGVNQVHGVAAGVLSATSLDAVNGSQLFATNQNVAANSAAIAALSVAIAENTYIEINSTGPAASATGTDAIAIGEGASASHANSIALGAGTATTAANQVNVGGRTVSGITPGALSATSTDAVTGSQLFATNATVATHTTQIGTLNSQVAAINTNIAGMQSDIDDLFELRDEDRQDTRKGIAAAVAMSTAPMPSTPGRISYTLNGAAFRGEYALGGSLMYRVPSDTPLAIGAGFSFAGDKNNAVRVGVAGEF